MRAVLREPLLHFLVLGLVIFGLFAYFDDTPPPASGQTIDVTAEDARRLVAAFEATWRRPPGQEELDRLIEQFLREEIYTREARALGLDQGDAIIRQRLRQKMEFLSEAGAEAVDPDDATLNAHLAANPERFARAPLVAFVHVLLKQETTAAEASEILAQLAGGGDPQAFARPSLLPAVLPPSPPRVIDGSFGSGFFDALDGLPRGEWAGPVRSAYGLHLVRLTERQPGGLPPLADIRERVLQDWRATYAAQLREERFDAMRARYRINLPDLSEVPAR